MTDLYYKIAMKYGVQRHIVKSLDMMLGHSCSLVSPARREAFLCAMMEICGYVTSAPCSDRKCPCGVVRTTCNFNRKVTRL